ncbi:MAG: quinolinate synthase NadA [Euryarchaeota archaeon]|nr:quinolinate synthase NadA [Euryarchaeota archaeon]
MGSVEDRIRRLKAERNAVILAHNYTTAAVQELADFVGDSLGLAQMAAATDADVIVFCGVSFMGETAKILCPGKEVLLPEPEAHCPMASMCTAEQIRQMRARRPGHAVVGYVNSTASSKTEMDICCTSSNAVEVVANLDADKVIFVPDLNLGAYVASKVGKEVVLWDGFCPIHHAITVRQVRALAERFPDAPVLAHPECRADVLAEADFIGSTEGILNEAKASDAVDFIILTEVGMGHRLERECPGKRFHFPEQAVCTAMKMIDPESVLHVLETGENRVVLPDDVMKRAYKPVKRMTENGI